MSGSIATNTVICMILVLSLLNPVQMRDGLPYWGMNVNASYEIFIEIPLLLILNAYNIWLIFKARAPRK